MRDSSACEQGNPCSTILVVEDDEDIRDAMRMALELEGYEVVGASNGKEGLEQLSHMNRPCLILLDLMMPVMNGWEFAEAMGANDVLATIPVTIVTAFPDRVGPLRNMPLIKKPVALDTLLTAVRSYCGAARPKGQDA